MTALQSATGFVRGSFLGLALFAAIAHGLLLIGWPVASWLLPLALVAGFAAATRLPSPEDHESPPVPAWFVSACFAVVAAVLGALIFGALVTPARHWDGMVAWEVKSLYLTAAPTLEQDYFRDPAVYCHSRDYPLLQPLLVATGNRLLGAGMGRWLFPFLYVLLVATVGSSLRRAGVRSWLCWAAAVALGVTPILVNPTGGGVDSGYAEVFVATCIAGIGAGLLLRDRALLAAGVFLLVLAKPEGLVYGVVPLLVAWVRDERKLLYAGLLGYLAAAALWLPLQRGLHPGAAPGYATVWLSLIGVGLLVAGSDALLALLFVSRRWRAWIAAVALPLLALGAIGLAMALGHEGGAMGSYLGHVDRVFERLPRLPAILLGCADDMFLQLRFALTFVLLVALAVAAWWRRRRPPGGGLGLFTALGLLAVVPPFLLSPEEDLQHHLRSSMPRLLLHWLGAVWLYGAVWLDALVAPDRWSGGGPPRSTA